VTSEAILRNRWNLAFKTVFLFVLKPKNHFEKFLDKNEVDLIYFVAQSDYINYAKSINYVFTLFDLCHRDCPEFPEVRNNKIFEVCEFTSRVYAKDNK
jgi:hypothetical protein